MTPHPSPFSSIAHRLARASDQAFASLMAGGNAVVRLVGPRRTGKTDLVSWFARTSRSPIVGIAVRPLPADLTAPAPLVAELLRREIATLTHTAPALHAAYDKLRRRENPPSTKFTLSGELAAIPKFSAGYERSAGAGAATAAGDADIEIAYTLRRLEHAAEKLRIRPVVFFDEIQELILHAQPAGLATIWAIRNEVQHHTHCRYVFAGSNQRLFAKLHHGQRAPLLNFGTALELPPLSIAEIDAWAVPLFTGGRRHLRSLAPAAQLLCGKIGEVVDVCRALWAASAPGTVLDEASQRAAVFAAARHHHTESKIETLNSAQTAVLRWVLHHPETPPYSADGLRQHLNPGTIKAALDRLLELELIESFNASRFSCTTPLRILASLTPQLWAADETRLLSASPSRASRPPAKRPR